MSNKIKVKKVKQRNFVVVQMMEKSGGGVHQKSNKAKRKQINQSLSKSFDN